MSVFIPNPSTSVGARSLKSNVKVEFYEQYPILRFYGFSWKNRVVNFTRFCLGKKSSCQKLKNILDLVNTTVREHKYSLNKTLVVSFSTSVSTWVTTE